MGRTMARRGTGEPLMKIRGLLEDLSEGEEEEEVVVVLAGGGVAVELGMKPLVPVAEDELEPEPDPGPDPDPELEPDPEPEPDPELVDDGLRMPDKNLEASGEIGKPGGPGGLGVGCGGPEGRLRDGKVGEAPEFRSRRRARRDGGVGGSIVEMRLAIPCRLDTRSLTCTNLLASAGERPTIFTSSAVGPAVKTEEGETGSLWDGGGEGRR